MHPRFPHPSAAERGHPAGTGRATAPSPASGTTSLTARLAAADRACCCLARPVVLVLLPPTARHAHAVDLLFCGHHYHGCKDALDAAGALVYDSRDLPAEAGQDTYDAVSTH
jgi:hypothetical protein